MSLILKYLDCLSFVSMLNLPSWYHDENFSGFLYTLIIASLARKIGSLELARCKGSLETICSSQVSIIGQRVFYIHMLNFWFILILIFLFLLSSGYSKIHLLVVIFVAVAVCVPLFNVFFQRTSANFLSPK